MRATLCFFVVKGTTGNSRFRHGRKKEWPTAAAEHFSPLCVWRRMVSVFKRKERRERERERETKKATNLGKKQVHSVFDARFSEKREGNLIYMHCFFSLSLFCSLSCSVDQRKSMREEKSLSFSLTHCKKVIFLPLRDELSLIQRRDTNAPSQPISRSVTPAAACLLISYVPKLIPRKLFIHISLTHPIIHLVSLSSSSAGPICGHTLYSSHSHLLLLLLSLSLLYLFLPAISTSVTHFVSPSSFSPNSFLTHTTEDGKQQICVTMCVCESEKAQKFWHSHTLQQIILFYSFFCTHFLSSFIFYSYSVCACCLHLCLCTFRNKQVTECVWLCV